MDLSFAKNSKIFSAAVESLRKSDKSLLSDAKAIKAEYEKIEKGLGAKSPKGSDDLNQNTSNSNVPAVQANIEKKAQALADKKGVDLTKVVGTGKDGQITVEDVKKAIK